MPTDMIEQLLTSLAVRAHAFALCEIEPGYRLTFPSVDSVTIHYILFGHGEIRTNEDIGVPYEPRCIIIVPAGTRHSLGKTDASLEIPTSAASCGLLTNGLLRFTVGEDSRDTLVVCASITTTYGGALGLFQGLNAPLVQTSGSNEALIAIFSALIHEVTEPGIGTQALVEALMKQALILLLRRHLLHLSSSSPFFTSLHDGRLLRAVAAVIEKPSIAWTVDLLAACAGMSRSSFAKRFMRSLSQSPMEFVHSVRLRLASELLRATDLPVPVIAMNAGYASRAYFSRVFKDVYGTSPAAYRSRARAGEAIAYGPPGRAGSSLHNRRDILTRPPGNVGPATSMGKGT